MSLAYGLVCPACIEVTKQPELRHQVSFSLSGAFLISLKVGGWVSQPQLEVLGNIAYIHLGHLPRGQISGLLARLY